jgi:Tol biopolymer transport system component
LLFSLVTLGDQVLDDSQNPSMSVDGKFVVFDSLSDTLVYNDTEGYWDVFLRNREANTTMRISEDSNGDGANSGSSHAQISSEGRYIVYQSYATSLDSRDTNFYTDIYLFDMSNYSTRCISLAPDGNASNGSSANPSISHDGRYITFASNASNLVASDNNNKKDIFVYDTENNTTSLLSIGDSPIQSDGTSAFPAISNDGSYITFYSDATNLVEDDYNNKGDVFIKENTLYEPENSFLPSVLMYLLQ